VRILEVQRYALSGKTARAGSSLRNLPRDSCMSRATVQYAWASRIPIVIPSAFIWRDLIGAP